jgi:hypothetical protein
MASSYFARYFCTTHFEYITPCTVMTYAMLDALQVTHLMHLMLASYDLV